MTSWEPPPARRRRLGTRSRIGIGGQRTQLRQAGARHFVIPDLFNVGLLPAAEGIPRFASGGQRGDQRVGRSNFWPIEQLLEGIHITRMDVFSLLNAVETDPTHFGFTDVDRSRV